MDYCDIAALDSTPLQHDPYDYLIVPDFLRADRFKSVSADYPEVPGPGSHPPTELTIHGAFKALMDELSGDEFRAAIERKFSIDLTGRPTMYTVRGFTRDKDGSIHTDSETKLITVLLYMNERWQEDGGRLRILRGPDDLEDYVAEVPPYAGTLLVFRRADNSWHGHKPFNGQRRTIQLNWVTNQQVADSEQFRHRVSTKIKRFTSMFTPGSAATGQ